MHTRKNDQNEPTARLVKIQTFLDDGQRLGSQRRQRLVQLQQQDLAPIVLSRLAYGTPKLAKDCMKK